MVHPACTASDLPGECGRWRVNNHGSAVFRRRGSTTKVFLGTSERTKSDSVGEPAPEDQEKCLTELQSDRHWVIWCKAKPKDMAAQLFREYGKCVFVGKCTRQKQVGESQAESSGGKHVTRAKGWWKRGDVAACAAQTNMHCWVHQDALFNDEQVETKHA